ncbi:YihY family inner membrane protein [Alcanivorax sp.]|uniref:YihY family inner membrane protein n=1 Tax=Alcanivorax sp. TaxID=1872427 RepID=UPI0025C1B516|nr:YihY family inner membrane protein [Alcanivorax sp.]
MHNPMDMEDALIPVRPRYDSVRAFLGLLVRQFNEDGCRQSAAALTYTTLFAIVPVMTVSFAVLASVPALKDKGVQFQQWAFDYFVPSAGNMLLDHLQSFAKQASNLTGLGIAFLVITSVLMLRTIEQTLNRMWKVPTARKGLTSLLTYWAVLSLGPIFLGAGLAISSYLTSMSVFNETMSFLGGARMWLTILPFVFTTLMLTLLYTVVPNTSVPIRQGVLGAAFAALLFELAKGAFTFFIKQAPSYQVVYGAFAAVPVFLLWLYISWTIVLGGAELVRALVVFQEHRSRVPRMHALLRLLHVFWERQQHGKTLRSKDVRKVMRQSGISQWDEFRNLLLDARVIQRTDEGGYILSRDLRNLTLAQLLAALPWPLHTQLRIRHQQELQPWEGRLKTRMDDARTELMGTLNVPLDELFRGELPEQKGDEEGNRAD